MASSASPKSPKLSFDAAMLHKKVLVVTLDGRAIVGTLKGLDKQTNLVLANAKERVFNKSKGVTHVDLNALYVARGSEVACVGKIDETKDESWEDVLAEPLRRVRQRIF